MSFTTNEKLSCWLGEAERSVHTQTLAQAQIIYKGALGMLIGGKAYRVSPLAPFALLVTGADANGGEYVLTRQAKVRYSQVVNGASAPLLVSVVFGTSVIDVIVQLATDGAGNITSKAHEVADAVRAHSVANQFLLIAPTGTGLGLTTAFAATSVPEIALLGAAEETYDNAAGLTDVTRPMRFYKGKLALEGLAGDIPTSAMIDSPVSLVDDQTIQATLNPFALSVRLVDLKDNRLYCDLT